MRGHAKSFQIDKRISQLFRVEPAAVRIDHQRIADLGVSMRRCDQILLAKTFKCDVVGKMFTLVETHRNRRGRIDH